MTEPNDPFVRVDFRINRSSAPRLYEELIQLPTSKLRARKVLALAEAMLNLAQFGGAHAGKPVNAFTVRSAAQVRQHPESYVPQNEYLGGESIREPSPPPKSLKAECTPARVIDPISDEEFDAIQKHLLSMAPQSSSSNRIRRSDSTLQPNVSPTANEAEQVDKSVDEVSAHDSAAHPVSLTALSCQQNPMPGSAPDDGEEGDELAMPSNQPRF